VRRFGPLALELRLHGLPFRLPHTGMRCFRTTNAPEPPQARSRERPLCSTLSVRVTKYTPAPLGAATGLRGEKLTIFATLDISTLQNAATVKFLE